MSLMKVLFVKQGFDPEPGFKGVDFVKRLQKVGVDCHVVTTFPHRPGGKIYKGYKLRALFKENIQGVSVNRVFIYPSHDSSAIKRTITYISFLISSVYYGLLKVKSVDLVYGYASPLTTALSSLVISKIKRVPLVLDVQDLWPESVAASGMMTNSILYKVLLRMSNYIYKNASHVIVLSNGFKKELVKRGVDKGDISVVYNWAAEKELTLDMDSVPKKPSDRFVITYAGIVGPIQNLEVIIAAAKKLKILDSRVVFNILGDGPCLEGLKLRAQHLDNITFHPFVSMSKVSGYLASSDALLVHLKKQDIFNITIPSKIQTYMFMGKPILAGVSGDAALLIKDSKSGLVFQQNSPDSLVKQVMEMVKWDDGRRYDAGRNGRQFYDREMSMNAGVEKFKRSFNKVKSL